MTAHRIVAGYDVLERARDVGGEDDVHNVLLDRTMFRRYGIDDRHRAFEGYLDSVGKQPGLFPQLTLQCANETLPRLNSSAGEKPHGTSSLLVASEQKPPTPAQDRGDTDSRLGHRRQLEDDPKPRPSRSLAASSSTSTRRTEATGAMTSCATRIPGSTTNGISRSVLIKTTRISPR